MERRSFFGALTAFASSLIFWRSTSRAISLSANTAAYDQPRDGRAGPLQAIARRALELFQSNVRKSSARWNWEEEVGRTGDVVCAGAKKSILDRTVLLTEKYATFVEEDRDRIDALWSPEGLASLEKKSIDSVYSAVIPLVEDLNDKLKTASIVVFRSLPNIPDGLGCQSVVASDGRYSVRVVRSYNNQHRVTEMSISVLYGTV